MSTYGCHHIISDVNLGEGLEITSLNQKRSTKKQNDNF